MKQIGSLMLTIVYQIWNTKINLNGTHFPFDQAIINSDDRDRLHNTNMYLPNWNKKTNI